MQEIWLFGELNTIGQSEVQQKMEQNAATIAELLNKLLTGPSAGSS